MTGYTYSTDFPTRDPLYPNNAGSHDAFVTRLSPAGDALVYSTYLGGSGDDVGWGIAVDATGNCYVTGYTDSTDFPTQDPLYPNNAGSYDAFVTSLSPAGDALIYSTYLGGSNSDYGSGIAVDATGNCYVTGYTDSTDFPTQDPLYPNLAGGWDVFVTRLSPAGDALLYSTYLGGSNYDYGSGIAVDATGNCYVTGYTDSTDFPTRDPLYPNNAGSHDVFITRLSPAGDALVYSTYLGGSGDDVGLGIAVDATGNCYVTGQTGSTDFPTRDPLYPNLAGGWDVFVTSLSPAGDALLYSTYLGGSNYDHGYGIAVDATGNCYVTGYTYSTDFPTRDPLYPNNAGFYDAFITRLSPAGDALVYSTYLGGSGGDVGNAIAVDATGNCYVTGYTESTDFPTQDPLYPDFAGGTYDAFVSKISSVSEGWKTAYNTLFDSPSDLDLLRQYRDEFLIKTTKGKLYTKLLYNRSEEALQVLLQNPELMMEAKHLIEANKDAVSEVLNGNEGVIYNTDEIVSFLKAYARKSPLDLKLLAIAVEKEMLRQQRQGEKFLGFKLK